MCECVCYCAYFYYVNKLYVHVCVLERAKHSFFALPNPLSCSVMNKICLNQVRHIGWDEQILKPFLADHIVCLVNVSVHMISM